MTTWQTIFGVDPPVKGELSQFETARNTFNSMMTDAQTVVDTFFPEDPSAITANVNDKPGAMITKVLAEADEALKELPTIAGDAYGIFDAHITRLRELRGEADGALARARTAWNRKNQLTSQKSQLESQITGLEGQIDGAADDADTTELDSDLSGARSSLGDVSSELESVQNTLDGIHGNEDSEYNELVGAENERNRTTVDDLDGISLGDLEDPNFLESAWEGISDFVQGLLESVANLLEALVTGDWATALWELKGLLDVALLVLGTIALFTGVGAPLFALAVANFAVTLSLYLSETPNPQTGKKMGLLDLGLSAAGVVMGSAGFLNTIKGVNGFKLFTRQAVRSNGPGGRFVYTATGARMPGVLSTMKTSFGQLRQIKTAPMSAHNAMRGLATFTKKVPYHGANGYASNAFVRTAVNADVALSTVWNARGAVAGVQNFAPAALPGDWSKITDSTGSETWSTTGDQFGAEWNYSNGVGNFGEQGTPMFSGLPSEQQVNQVAQQVRESPDVHIIPVP